MGGFGWDQLMPSYVFTQQLGPNYAKYIWEATSHEIGWVANPGARELATWMWGHRG